MSEVCLPLLELPSGGSYKNDTDDVAYIITEDHTISDVLRFLITQTTADELALLLRPMIEEELGLSFYLVQNGDA